MVVCFEIEENLEKKSNSLFERGVFFTFDMSTGVISKYVNWLNKIKFGYEFLTSLGMRGTNVPPIFEIALKSYFTSIPSD